MMKLRQTRVLCWVEAPVLLQARRAWSASTMLAAALLGLLLLGCGASAAAPAPLGASPAGDAGAGDAAVIAELTRQAAEWDRAIVAKDREKIAANMAEDFRQIDGDAHVETKASFVEGVMAAPLSIDPFVNEEFEVRVYGEVALLSGRTRMTGRFGDKAFTSHYRYIDVYVRRAGQWKIVSLQITRIKE